jgi:hypothetical protein
MIDLAILLFDAPTIPKEVFPDLTAAGSAGRLVGAFMDILAALACLACLAVPIVLFLLMAAEVTRHLRHLRENRSAAVHSATVDEALQHWNRDASEAATTPRDVVTPSPRKAGQRLHCPACSAPITEKDERCPSCDIAFISDGSQGWRLPAVGPADGIYLPPTDVRE